VSFEGYLRQGTNQIESPNTTKAHESVHFGFRYSFEKRKKESDESLPS